MVPFSYRNVGSFQQALWVWLSLIRLRDTEQNATGDISSQANSVCFMIISNNICDCKTLHVALTNTQRAFSLGSEPGVTSSSSGRGLRSSPVSCRFTAEREKEVRGSHTFHWLRQEKERKLKGRDGTGRLKSRSLCAKQGCDEVQLNPILNLNQKDFIYTRGKFFS